MSEPRVLRKPDEGERAIVTEKTSEKERAEEEEETIV
jgi:hypothetical protein